MLQCLRTVPSILAVVSVVFGQEPPAPALASTTAEAAKHYETGVAAYVNRDIITKAEVWKRIRGKEESLAAMSEERRQAAFDHQLLEMISELVVRQGKDRLQLSIPEQALKAMIEERKEAAGGTEAFQKSIADQGFLTERDYATQYGEKMENWIYVQTQTGKLKSLGVGLRAEHVIEPTASEIRSYYQSHLEKEFQSEAEVKVRLINLSFTQHGGLGTAGTPPEQAEARTLELARKLKADLATGADFATLAGRYSTINPEKGGDQGWLNQESIGLAPELLKLALDMSAGTVSEPIHMRRSYALILVEERKEARTVPFVEAQVAIRQKLKEDAIERASAAVELKLIKEAWIEPPKYQTFLLAQREHALRGITP